MCLTPPMFFVSIPFIILYLLGSLEAAKAKKDERGKEIKRYDAAVAACDFGDLRDASRVHGASHQNCAVTAIALDRGQSRVACASWRDCSQMSSETSICLSELIEAFTPPG